MGNENSFQDGTSKTIVKRCKHKTQTFDEFFQHYHKMYNISHTIDVSSITPKRIVFISITGLWNSWKRCPPISLYNAIIIIPLREEWIREPDEYKHEYNYMLNDEQFLTLLRWKEHQNLALFMLDDDDDDDDEEDEYDYYDDGYDYDYYDESSDSNDIDANGECRGVSIVWRRLSLMLQGLYDPIGTNANGKYNALQLQEEYWRQKSCVCKDDHNKLFPKVADADGCHDHMTEYCMNVDDILWELYTVTMRFNTIKCILTDSNPTLHVVTNYVDVTNRNRSLNTRNEDHLLDDQWWIADDYYDN